MRPEGLTIQALLWRTFTPAIVVAAIALGALVYNHLYATILDGFSRKLTTTSALAGAFIDPADHDYLIAAARGGAPAEQVEKDPRYVRNVEPMRRIRRELGLTYLYSQVIGGKKGVIYVLDATEGDDHSPIGTEDDLPADTMAGLRAVTARGGIYASPIQYQEQWGLLKTAAAPARGADGRITGTVGADVNIGVIQVATQNALFASALIGIGSLLACALVTLAIMRRVAQPIEALKADALRIAAGDRNPPSHRAAPREVTGLRRALGELATALIARMRAAWGEMLAEDRARNLQLLAQVLADEPAAVTLVDTKDVLAVWVAPDGDDAAARLQRRAMRALAARIAAEPSLVADWEALADGTVVVLDRAARTARVLGERPVALNETARGVEADGRLLPWTAGR